MTPDDEMRGFVSPESETTVHPYQPSVSIRLCTLDGLVVLLDLRVGRYLIFDAVASYMWNLLVSEADHEQRLDSLASRFDVTRSRCKHDLDEFLESCKKRGLLRTGTVEAPINTIVRVRYISPKALSAWKCLYTTGRSLAHVGFSATYDIHCRMAGLQTSIGRDAVSLSTALRAFRRAENFWPTRDARKDCLPRSLALHRFLLSIGIDADHCIGVRRFPFRAHAWVEVGKTVVCDSESFVRQFTEIARASHATFRR
jgi:hypothetical protein